MEIMACLEAEIWPGYRILERQRETPTVVVRSHIETKSNEVPVHLLNPGVEKVTMCAGAEISNLEHNYQCAEMFQ